PTVPMKLPGAPSTMTPKIARPPGMDWPSEPGPIRLPSSRLPLATATGGQPSLTTVSSAESSLVLFAHCEPDSAVPPTTGHPSLTAPSASLSLAFWQAVPASGPPKIRTPLALLAVITLPSPAAPPPTVLLAAPVILTPSPLFPMPSLVPNTAGQPSFITPSPSLSEALAPHCVPDSAVAPT